MLLKQTEQKKTARINSVGYICSSIGTVSPKRQRKNSKTQFILRYLVVRECSRTCVRLQIPDLDRICQLLEMLALRSPAQVGCVGLTLQDMTS